jgi:hypothetical protein
LASKLVTVEDVFDIKGRGLVVVPGPALSDYDGPKEVSVQLRRPDGSTAAAVLHYTRAFLVPTPAIIRWELILKSVTKEEVPIGTEIWSQDSVS